MDEDSRPSISPCATHLRHGFFLPAIAVKACCSYLSEPSPALLLKNTCSSRPCGAPSHTHSPDQHARQHVAPHPSLWRCNPGVVHQIPSIWTTRHINTPPTLLSIKTGGKHGTRVFSVTWQMLCSPVGMPERWEGQSYSIRQIWLWPSFSVSRVQRDGREGRFLALSHINTSHACHLEIPSAAAGQTGDLPSVKYPRKTITVRVRREKKQTQAISDRGGLTLAPSAGLWRSEICTGLYDIIPE